MRLTASRTKSYQWSDGFMSLLVALDFERKLLCSVVSTPSGSTRFVSGVPNRLCGAEEACRHVRGEEAA